MGDRLFDFVTVGVIFTVCVMVVIVTCDIRVPAVVSVIWDFESVGVFVGGAGEAVIEESNDIPHTDDDPKCTFYVCFCLLDHQFGRSCT